MKIAILNGHVIDPSQNLDGKKHILVCDGKIEALTDSSKLNEAYQIIDAKGSVVAPGFIDCHTHLRDPGFEYREDIESGSRSAAAGGFTTVLCMANTEPVNDSAAVTQVIMNRAAEVGLVKILPVGAVSKGLKGEEMADIGEMVTAGCVAVSDDGMPVMSGKLMRHAMEYAKSFNVPIITHAEDLTLSDGGSMHEGIVSTQLGLKGIPAAAEESMIARDLLLTELTGHRLHVAHVSTAKGIAMIRRAKRDKLQVTCEVTPHHLTLTDNACLHYNANAKVNPPLRTEKDCEALIEGLNDGTVDAIATDHAPHAQDEKDVGFGCANFGLIGMESALPVLLRLVEQKKVTLQKLIELLTVSPANIFGIPAGTLKKGAAADIVVFDPKLPVSVCAEAFQSKSRNTPFEGMAFKGKVLYTICKGNVVYSS